MAAFLFTRRAESDLDSIADYSLRTWGAAQTSKYLAEMKICCQSLANSPALGRLHEYIRPGLHRFEHGMHVVFYRRHHDGILIVRILHQSMLPEKHSMIDQQS